MGRLPVPFDHRVPDLHRVFELDPFKACVIISTRHQRRVDRQHRIIVGSATYICNRFRTLQVRYSN
jgi:hypothetical protein